MNKVSNAQYSNNLFARVGYGYKLSYLELTNRLVLVDRNGKKIFDVSFDEIEKISRTQKIFINIKLKDGSTHFISFGTALDSRKVAEDSSASPFIYRKEMKEWLEIFKEKGFDTGSIVPKIILISFIVPISFIILFLIFSTR